MWIILHYNQDTLNVLEFSNLTKYDHTIVLNFFWKGTNHNIPIGIRTHDLQIGR